MNKLQLSNLVHEYLIILQTFCCKIFFANGMFFLMTSSKKWKIRKLSLNFKLMLRMQFLWVFRSVFTIWKIKESSFTYVKGFWSSFFFSGGMTRQKWPILQKNITFMTPPRYDVIYAETPTFIWPYAWDCLKF